MTKIVSRGYAPDTPATDTIKFIECLENDLEDTDLSKEVRNEKQFLHNQYFIYLMYLRGMTKNYLDPENGGMEFYNIENLKQKYIELKKNPTHLLIGWGAKLSEHETWIELLEKPPVDYDIRSMKKAVDSIEHAVNTSRALSEVISLIFDSMVAILLTDNYVRDHPFEDCYIHIFPEDKQIIPLYDLILLWNKDELKSCCPVCNSGAYIFKIKCTAIRNDYQWKGYCPTCGDIVDAISGPLEKVTMPLYELNERYRRSIPFLKI